MSESEEYSLIILGKVNPEAPLPSDIYLHVDKKYIKFRSKGDMITQQKFDLFISKGVKNLYVKNEDIMMFLEWISETAEEEIEGLVAEGGEENRGVFERSAGMKEKVYDLAQVVALANTFDNLLQEHKRLPQAEKFKRAIKYIEMQNGKMFSPKLYPRVLDALKLAFGNFKRDTVVS